MNTRVKRSGIFHGGDELTVIENVSTKKRYGLFFVPSGKIELSNFLNDPFDKEFDITVAEYRSFASDSLYSIKEIYDKKLLEWESEVGTYKELQAKKDLILEERDREVAAEKESISHLIGFIDVYAFYAFFNIYQDVDVARVLYHYYLFSLKDFMVDYEFSDFSTRIEVFKAANKFVDSKAFITISHLMEIEL